MSSLGQPTNDKIFLGIVGGKLVQTVPEGTPNAVRREWEAGGKTGVKWELQHDNITGKIEEISFYEGEKDGRKFVNLSIRFDKTGDKYPVLSVGTTSKYAEDLMKKLPNINKKEDVKIRPFSYIPDGKDKPVSGVEVKQQDGTGQFNKKITNFFWDANALVEGKDKKGKSVNGMPTPTVEELENSDWEMFYKRVNRFLTKYTRENIVTKTQSFTPPQMPARNEINPDDIPF